MRGLRMLQVSPAVGMGTALGPGSGAGWGHSALVRQPAWSQGCKRGPTGVCLGWGEQWDTPSWVAVGWGEEVIASQSARARRTKISWGRNYQE